MLDRLLKATQLVDIRIALAFFTRLPQPHFSAPERRLGQAMWAAPLAGLAVALIGWLAIAVADFFNVPTLAAAALAMAAMMLATGCLHEDGLADVTDGFGGGKTTEAKLEIMHDSRLGTYGAAALLISVLIRWSCLVALVQRDAAFFGLVAAHVGSRAVFAPLMRVTPLARDSGLAGTVGAISDETLWVSLAVGVAGLLFLGGFGAFAALLLIVGTSVFFQRLCMRQIGGMTGDTLGASQQIAEMTLLVVAAAILA